MTSMMELMPNFSEHFKSTSKLLSQFKQSFALALG